MQVRIRVRLRPNAPACDDPQLFRGIPPERRPGLWSLLGSAGVHAAGVLALMLAAKILGQFAAEPVDFSKYRVEKIRLHLGETIFFTANTPAPAPKRLPSPKPARTEKAPVAGLTAGSARTTGAPRHLELPAPRQAAKAGPIILQPDFRPQLAPPPSLPAMAFWARGAEAPKPAHRAEIVPGRNETPSPAPKLAAPPVLAAPNREPAVADVNVALNNPPTPTPALPIPNSSTMPVRLRDATESQAASFDVTAGQGVNVIALSNDHAPVRSVDVPRGLQNIPQSAADGEPGAGSAAQGATSAHHDPAAAGGVQASAPAGGKSAAGPPGNTRQGTGGSSSTAAAASTGASSSTTAAASAGASAGRGSKTAETAPKTVSAGVAPLAAARPAAAAAGGVTRIEHPVNGNFDVVVMQSAIRDDLSALGNQLTGTPVYSVYLPVGDRKEWLLEYCVPAKQNAQDNPYQINIDEVGNITPPYPLSTAVPNSFLAQPFTKNIVLHGLLTTGGALREIKSPDVSSGLLNELLALLTEWRFRPALRNKKPIDVEILLVIPPRG